MLQLLEPHMIAKCISVHSQKNNLLRSIWYKDPCSASPGFWAENCYNVPWNHTKVFPGSGRVKFFPRYLSLLSEARHQALTTLGGTSVLVSWNQYCWSTVTFCYLAFHSFKTIRKKKQSKHGSELFSAEKTQTLSSQLAFQSRITKHFLK